MKIESDNKIQTADVINDFRMFYYRPIHIVHEISGMSKEQKNTQNF